MLLIYVDGPRDGETREYNGDERGPRAQGCVTEATAKGMYGYYRQQDWPRKPKEDRVVMLWRDLRAEK